MTQIAIRTGSAPLSVELGSALRLNDEEFFELCRRNRELRIERTSAGNLVIMSPVGGESSHRNAEAAFALMAWAKKDGTGVVFDSSAGFVLPNGAMRSPDAAWVKRFRWDALTPEQRRKFVPLVPDFVMELRSPSDALSELQEKMEEFRASGVRLGWLVDPAERRIHVYRPKREIQVLDGPHQISGDPELPGFVLDLGPIWQPV